MRLSPYIAAAALVQLGFFGVSCQPKSSSIQGTPKHKTMDALKDGTVQKTTQDENEAITAPANITGTHLFCEPTVATFTPPQAQTLGCAIFSQSNQTRVDVRTVATNIEWDIDRRVLGPGTTLSTFKADPTQGFDHDVYFAFQGLSEPLEVFKSRLTVIMQVTRLDGQRVVYRNTTHTALPPVGGNGGTAPADVLGNP